MPAVSKAQQKFMGMCSHSDHPPANCPDKETAREFAHTGRKNLPEHKGPRKKRAPRRPDDDGDHEFR